MWIWINKSSKWKQLKQHNFFLIVSIKCNMEQAKLQRKVRPLSSKACVEKSKDGTVLHNWGWFLLIFTMPAGFNVLTFEGCVEIQGVHHQHTNLSVETHLIINSGLSCEQNLSFTGWVTTGVRCFWREYLVCIVDIIVVTLKMVTSTLNTTTHIELPAVEALF